jgi:hypothetical protein
MRRRKRRTSLSNGQALAKGLNYNVYNVGIMRNSRLNFLIFFPSSNVDTIRRQPHRGFRTMPYYRGFPILNAFPCVTERSIACN